MDIRKIDIRTNEYLMADRNNRRVDQICVFAYDLWFYADVCSERDIRLAYRMAEDLGLKVTDMRGSENDPEPRYKTAQQTLPL